MTENAPAGFFERTESVPPGFVNFWISKEILQKSIVDILDNKKERKAGGKIQIEFVSANPTGPLTLANGRGGFLGDVLANVWEYSGYDVEREYYINDSGNQILTFGKSILAAKGLIPMEENFYQGEYVKEWAEKNGDLVD